MRNSLALIAILSFTTTSMAGVNAATKSGAVAGGELKFVADYCHLQLTPAGKKFLTKSYKANPHLFDAQYASEEKGLSFDDNGKLTDDLPCENWYGDYLKGGSSYSQLGFEPFVAISPE